MDRQILARRSLGLVLLLIAVLLASPAAEAQASPPPRVSLDAAARSVRQALSGLAADAAPPSAAVGPFSAGGGVSTPSSPSPSLADAARADCVELLGDSLELLAAAGAPGAARDDALAWLSAALASHDTCADGLAEAGLIDDDENVPTTMNSAAPGLAAARGTVRDALAALFYDASSATAAPAPGPSSGCGCKNETQHRDECGFPLWLPSTDRSLLLLGAAAGKPLKDAADLVVAQDGTGTHGTIAAAVDAAPECSARRTVIHVKAGTYDEVVRVGTEKTNLVFVGDGAGRTVVTGNRSKAAADNVTTFQTATFGTCAPFFPFPFLFRQLHKPLRGEHLGVS